MPGDESAVDIDFSGPFTLDEIVEIEAMTGRPITELMEGPRGGTLRYVAYVIGRRTNPDLTLAEVGQLWVKLDG